MASPPVVRFLDFGQYKYELTKREKEAKRKQRSVTFKEVRLSPKIGIGDFDTKVNRAIEFLEDGDRIKVTVRFRGRELTHPELGRNLLARFTERVKDHGLAERTPLLEGKSMHITMASTHKPKGHDAPATKGADAAETRGSASPAPNVAPTGAPVQSTLPAAPAPPAPVAASDPPSSLAPAAAPKPISVEPPEGAPSGAPPAPAADGSPAAASSAEVNASAPKPARTTPAVSAKPRATKAPAKSGTARATGDSEDQVATKSAAQPRATRTTKARTPAPEPVATGE